MNLHAASTRLVPLLCLALLTLAGCSLFGDDRLPFEWVEVGNKLTYDYRAVSDSVVDRQTGEVVTYVQGALDLRVVNPGFGEFLLSGIYPADRNRFRTPLLRITRLSEVATPGPKRGRKGLLAVRWKDCDSGMWSSEAAYEIRVPARPRRGDVYHTYYCENDVFETYTVTAVDTSIIVPAGTFEVFVMKHVPNGTTASERHYWSEQEGLIKMEFLKEDGSVRGAYELASRSWVNTPQP